MMGQWESIRYQRAVELERREIRKKGGG